MTDRERLLQILNVAIFPHEGEDPLEAVTDYLLDNGVTFAKDTNVPSWVPIPERLPERMMQCVCRYVFGDNTEYPFYEVMWYFDYDKVPHFQNEGSMGLRGTHWMPLPEPPKEDGHDLWRKTGSDRQDNR